MNHDDVWETIDAERRSLTDMAEGLTADEWAAPSLDILVHGQDIATALQRSRAMLGPIGTILMTLVGRTAMLSQLNGPGVADLKSHLTISQAA